MPQLDKYFQLTIDQCASDLHMPAGSPPCIRINGDLVKLEAQPLTHEQNMTMFSEIMNERSTQEFKKKRQVDFAHSFGATARFRTNIFMQRRGISGSFRLIPGKIITVEQLQLPEAIVGLCKLKKGLILVTGPTGSGKSTTLAALIDFINQSLKGHVITIEDPIEFVHQNKTCLVSQRQVGESVDSFSDGLRAALREDPDIILVGEMRDLETISMAITAAETGHLVFGTLHTTSASKTVDRIIDAFPVTQQEMIRTILSDSLKGVIAQTLLKRTDGKGRIAAFEILLGVPALANLIRENKSFQIPSLIQTQRGLGMQLMDQALIDLVKQRKVSMQDAGEWATDKKTFKMMAEGQSQAPR